MKKRLIVRVALVALVATSAMAQFRWAPVAGLNVTTLSFKQKLVPVHQVVGYQAGMMGELIFPGLGFGLDLGLLYNQQGARVDLSDRLIWESLDLGNPHVYVHTVQIPLHLRFKWTRMEGLEETIALFVYGGPDFSIQVAHGGGEAFDFSGGDLGLTCGLGAELWRHWQVSASYTWGMTYVLRTKLLDDFSARSRQWTVRLAYMF